MTTSNRNTTDLNSRVDELERELNRLRLIDQQRRELAAALDESQRKLREVASRAPLVLWAVDQDGIVTMSMGRGLDGLGLTPEQAIGRNVYEMYPDVPEIEQHIRAALRGEEQSYEQEVRGRWFGTWLEPVRDGAGAICGAHGISYDVTDQKTAEHALQESNNFLQAVAQTAPAAIALMAADGSKYRFVSGGIERLLGISPRVFMDFGPSFALSLIHPDDLPRVLAEHQAALELHNRRAADAPSLPMLFEYRMRHRDGNWRWIHTYGTVFERDATGQITYVLNVNVDVTAQKEAEQALRASNDFLQAIAATVPGSITIFDQQSQQYEYVSAGIEQLLGISAETFRTGGLPLVHGLIHPDDLPRVIDENAQAIARYEQLSHDAQPTVTHFEYRMRHRDGSWRWLHTCGTVFERAADGRVLRMVKITADITARKTAEAELQRLHGELERRIIERTEGLHKANAELQAEVVRRMQTEIELANSIERFNTMVEGSRIGLWDAQSLVLDDLFNPANACYFSPWFKQMLGYHPDELPDQLSSFFAHVHPDDVNAVRDEITRHLMQRTPHRDIEFRMFTRDGQLRWFSARGLGRWDKDGRPTRFSGAVIDITAQKHDEEQRLQQQEFLRGLIKSHESDRQLMAYELHDGLLQDLTGAIWQFDVLRDALGGASAEQVASYDETRQLLRRALDEGRRLLSGLRPPILDERGVIAALEFLVAEHRLQHAIDLRLHTNVQFDRLEPLFEATIFRIVQQALANIAAHSQATRAEVSLIQLPHSLLLSIRDWGVGFDIGQVKRDRFGLQGIQRRAELVGGEAQVESRPGHGTRISVRLPVTSAPAATLD